ncbi:XdhC family protein [Desulfohalovibrio reitneri]|uniref:XdhC family protein n=1 Tax=Desulfohalovibrio reitneri TaxID=1307759 RepID=UPI0004A6B30E|nr:XdhC/CoxI family protein [Desulfohalovibrio reitneri]
MGIEALRQAARELEAGRNCALATVVRTQGCTPRGPGARLLLTSSGQVVGSVGGGALEAWIVEQARDSLATGNVHLVEFATDDGDWAESEETCGGWVEALVQPLHPDTETSRALETFLAARHGGGPKPLLFTGLDWTDLRKRPRFHSSGSAGEAAAGTCLPEDFLISEAMRRAAEEAERLDSPVLVTCGGDCLLVEPLPESLDVVVLGAGRLGRETALLAQRCGFPVAVADDRPDRLTRLKNVDAFRVADMNNALRELAGHRNPLTGSTLVVITSRDPRFDETLLREALASPAPYIALPCTEGQRDDLFRKLLEEGYSQEDLDRVECPGGLDLGGLSPEELAVGIVARLIQLRAKERARETADPGTRGPDPAG